MEEGYADGAEEVIAAFTSGNLTRVANLMEEGTFQLDFDL